MIRWIRQTETNIVELMKTYHISENQIKGQKGAIADQGGTSNPPTIGRSSPGKRKEITMKESTQTLASRDLTLSLTNPEKKPMKVQHFLQVSSLVIGRHGHRTCDGANTKDAGMERNRPRLHQPLRLLEQLPKMAVFKSVDLD